MVADDNMTRSFVASHFNDGFNMRNSLSDIISIEYLEPSEEETGRF